jgi:hypothetical protein
MIIDTIRHLKENSSVFLRTTYASALVIHCVYVPRTTTRPATGGAFPLRS